MSASSVTLIAIEILAFYPRKPSQHTMRPWRLLCFLWFAIHIPTSLLIDSQSVLPLEYFPQELKDLLQWHIKTSGDHLVRDNPLWFVSFVYCEIYVQLPFFFIAAYAYLAGKNWIRIPAIMYGVHAATTVIPMLADFWYGQGADNPHKAKLMAIYGTYFVFPLAIALHMAFSRVPFKASGQIKKKVA